MNHIGKIFLVIGLLIANFFTSTAHADNVNAVKYSFDMSINGLDYEPFTTTLAIGVPATLTYSNSFGEEELKVKVTAQLSKTPGKAIVSHSILKNLSGSWVELSSPLIEFSDKSTNENVVVNNREASEIIISGRTELIALSDETLSKTLQKCPESKKPDLKSDSVVLPQARSCCGATCGNGQQWQCCGAVACCNCGHCCQIP